MSAPNDFAIQYAIQLPNGQLYLSPQSGAVVTWSEREGAEYVLDQLAAHSHHMGMTDWTAHIVHRYCTPFVPLDQALAEQMIDELTTWLHKQGGGS
ncbi:hypothetical protein H7J71_25060 [Mycolicibacterium peregrinum]|uniref:hypothetical protein n=1 Tax=Mycolicibacterium peregrinum TaxID=43304 RepID=UPI0006D813AC|nr:hypothetical protein [Mycolicibacterium peregrinum]MCV7205280.1 hypothetical protein [Mycolicibacterium peregrinum]ORW54820.1 hypothetical protein AWC21_24080 [Mycolicibacterium peregrinum]